MKIWLISAGIETDLDGLPVGPAGRPGLWFGNDLPWIDFTRLRMEMILFQTTVHYWSTYVYIYIYIYSVHHCCLFIFGLVSRVEKKAAGPRRQEAKQGHITSEVSETRRLRRCLNRRSGICLGVWRITQVRVTRRGVGKRVWACDWTSECGWESGGAGLSTDALTECKQARVLLRAAG